MQGIGRRFELGVHIGLGNRGRARTGSSSLRWRQPPQRKYERGSGSFSDRTSALLPSLNSIRAARNDADRASGAVNIFQF